MPSASSKSEKTSSAEATDPLQKAIVAIEHKIRNLEKRKSRLDTYKESTKPLTKEQVVAVSKYDEVIHQLELSREYVKQFTSISVESEKLKKKQARKEAQERVVTDINKIKHVLLIQDVLQNMGGEEVREDFLAGRNGATQLSEEDLKTLDDLFSEVSPKRAAEEAQPTDQYQKAAEHLLAIIEGKQKELAGTTCAKLRQLITTIHGCGYFEQSTSEDAPVAVGAAPAEPENEAPEEEEFTESQEILSNVIVPSQNPTEGNGTPATPATGIQPIHQSGPGVAAGALPSMMAGNMINPNVQNIVPTPVTQVESGFFNAQGFKPPAPQSSGSPAQNARQISEVIPGVTGKFNFLQESELEANEMNPSVVGPTNPPVNAPQVAANAASAIPTRTFTNQSFNGQPSGGPGFPPNYPTQPGAFQTFVPGFPGFVAPNTSPTPNNNASNNSNSNSNAKTNNNNSNNKNNSNTNETNNNNNCNNNIPTPIPMPPTRSPNVTYNQSQQQLTSAGFTTQPNTQPGSQPPSQAGYQQGSMAPLDNNTIDDPVRSDSERKDKKEDNHQFMNQTDNWADEWEPSEWNPQTTAQGPSNQSKFSNSRSNRNNGGGGGMRNTNGYQGNRNRNRPGGYRDSQNNQTGGSSSNYYQHQNGYQTRNDRNNDYSGGSKNNSDYRDNTFKERGDYNNRDGDNREGYNSGGGFKRGPSNRAPNTKGPMDRGDRQGQVPRNNAGGPRPQRNVPRKNVSGNGPSCPRPNQGGQSSNK